MVRVDLTDKEWAVTEPLLPTGLRVKPGVYRRKVLSGIRTGALRADLPDRWRGHDNTDDAPDTGPPRPL